MVKSNLSIIIILNIIIFSLNVFSSAESKVEVELFGAVAQVDITPREGTPIAGYGGGKRRLIPFDVFGRYPYAKYFKPHQGQYDPIRAKVFVLKKGESNLLFISLDLVGTISHFKEHLLQKIEQLGYTDENVFITSTHTHSGPGALTYNPLWELMAMDKFNKKIYAKFISQLVNVVLLAHQHMVPVQLMTESFPVPGVQRNRSILHEKFDNMANILLMRTKSDSKWLGGMVNFALHGTALGMSNTKFSADVLGRIENGLEQKLRELNGDNSEPTMLFLNGALGDVSPIYGGVEGMNKTAKIFIQYFSRALKNIKPVASSWDIISKEVTLGNPGLSVYNCSRENFLGKFIKWSKFLKKRRLSFRSWLPKKEKLLLVRLGNILMMHWPGEPTTDLGLAVKTLALKKATYAWNVGLSNNHLAYFVTSEEEKMATKEACNSFYTSKASANIVTGFAQLIDEM